MIIKRPQSLAFLKKASFVLRKLEIPVRKNQIRLPAGNGAGVQKRFIVKFTDIDFKFPPSSTTCVFAFRRSVGLNEVFILKFLRFDNFSSGEKSSIASQPSKKKLNSDNFATLANLASLHNSRASIPSNHCIPTKKSRLRISELEQSRNSYFENGD